MSLEGFDKLEEGLGRLLKIQEGLAAENQELKDSVGLKDLEIEELREKLNALEEEKKLVKEKVDVLLGRLEGLIQGA